MRHRTALWMLTGSVIAVACGGSQEGSGAGAGESTGVSSAASTVATPGGAHDRRTTSPIRHVVVIIGENRTFDHVFATYRPKNGQRISNLLAKKIVNEDGSPGPRFAAATQFSAVDSADDGYRLSPPDQTPFATLPPPRAGGPTTPFVSSLAEAQDVVGNDLPAADLGLLLTGGTGLTSGAIDTRIPNVNALPPGPFPLTPAIAYDAYTGDPVHRFYQMWQQLDCSVEHATRENPSGCTSSLFPWVASTISTGSNGNPPPTPLVDREGARSMGFYNVAAGDAPYFTSLADTYAMSDNFHQSIEGGTGANHVALGTGDAIWYSDGQGTALTPPALNTEDPNPQPGSNNYYTQDGYSGGTYTDCSDRTHPGVGPIVHYLHELGVASNCDRGHYYLLNNYAPGYFGDGTVNSGQFAIPPSSVRNIGDELLERDVSWRYYGADWNRYVADPMYANPENNYCDICNPFQYATSIMANEAVRTTHIKDTIDLAADIQSGWLPAVSIVKPSGLIDGHPASSKLDLFESFSKKIIEAIQAQPDLWKDTAIFVTFDEGGGYWDSGYVQPVDYFGDGTRIPLIAVSPFATGGRISHHYADHVSILKFIERNWRLDPITDRSRDNLPNPKARPENPWVPRNAPALDDLFDLFAFGHRAPDEDRP
jgi:phospholipase C